jgi:hypothetical protein
MAASTNPTTAAAAEAATPTPVTRTVQHQMGAKTVTIRLKGNLKEIEKRAATICELYADALTTFMSQLSETQAKHRAIAQKKQEATNLLNEITTLQSSDSFTDKLKRRFLPSHKDQKALVNKLNKEADEANDAIRQPFTDFGHTIHRLYQITYSDAKVE